MKQIPTWEPPKTSRVYLHPCGSRRLVSLYPDMKITDLDLGDHGRHYNQPGFGVHLIFGSEPGDCDMERTVWDKPSSGIPVYTLNNVDAENGCALRMTAFSVDPEQDGPSVYGAPDADHLPLTYCELEIRNVNRWAVRGTAGLLPRYNEKDHYLTGLHDTGYEPYNPTIGQWYLSWQNRFSPLPETPAVDAADGCGSVDGSPRAASSETGYGWMYLLEREGGTVRWVSRDEQKDRFRAHDYYRFDYALAPGGTAVLRFVMRRKAPARTAAWDGTVPSYADALLSFRRFWEGIQARVTCLPDTEGLDDLFRHNIAVSLQMLQRYERCKDPAAIYCRQGDVGRFIWIWEAVHLLTLLDRVGLSEYVTDAYRMWVKNWQKTDPADPERGLFADPYVKWDNANGSALWGMGYHLLTTGDPALFAEFREPMLSALGYIRYRRDPVKAAPGEVKGLFSSGQASDWGEIGQHWTYTDAVNVWGIGFMADAFERFGDPEAPAVRAEYEEYRSVVQGVLDRFAAEHRGERSYNMPHILGTPFEKSYNHCFSTDGAPYLIRLGFMDPHSEIFEQMEAFYREIGMLDDEHGLSSRMTNDDCGSPGLYGNVYYTGVSEICWIEAWKARGEAEKAEAYLRGLLKYNITSEYIVSERYASVDPWFTPWQPNGSGAGRLNGFLLDYYGEREAPHNGNVMQAKGGAL